MGVAAAAQPSLAHHRFFYIKPPSPNPHSSQFAPFPRLRTPHSLSSSTTIPKHGRAIARAIEEGQEQKLNGSTDSDERTELGETSRDETLGGSPKGSGGDGWWRGVAEEIGEIEWPAFGRVVGTTGVVLAVIAGSSVVLLTVNAVLAELSDRVFNGRGVQDFFG